MDARVKCCTNVDFVLKHFNLEHGVHRMSASRRESWWRFLAREHWSLVLTLTQNEISRNVAHGEPSMNASVNTLIVAPVATHPMVHRSNTASPSSYSWTLLVHTTHNAHNRCVVNLHRLLLHSHNRLVNTRTCWTTFKY